MSSNLINRRIFRRPSESQDGWLNSAQAPPPPAFDPSAGWAATADQTRSFRTEDKKTDKFYIQHGTPKVDWIGTLGLWEVPWGVGTQDETKSFRTQDQKTDKTYLQHGQPAFSWLKDVLGLQDPVNNWDLSYFPATLAETQSFRSSDKKTDRTYLQQDLAGQFSWLRNVLTLWEVWYNAAIQDETRSFRSADSLKDKTFIRQDQPAPAWIYTSLPVVVPFDPQLWPAIQQITQAYRIFVARQRPDTTVTPDAFINNILGATALNQTYIPTFRPRRGR